MRTKKIRAPIHLSDGNEEQLIEIFREIAPYDWVFSTWRSHYHALLHGVPREMVMSEIMAGRSMMLHFPGWRFFTSAIVGGILPIACGVAAASKEDNQIVNPWVWCFVGDMTASNDGSGTRRGLLLHVLHQQQDHLVLDVDLLLQQLDLVFQLVVLLGCGLRCVGVRATLVTTLLLTGSGHGAGGVTAPAGPTLLSLW